MQTIIPLLSLTDTTLPSLCEMEQQLFKHASWDRHALIELHQQPYNHFFGLQMAGALVGYAILQVMLDTAELLRIGVAHDNQGEGLGRQLLQAVLAFLATTTAERLLLEVRQDNIAAIRLYQAMGFTQIHVRKNYYQTQDGTATDALIMQLNLMKI